MGHRGSCFDLSSVVPMFSSKSFIVSGVTFRSLIPSEFIFVCGFRKCTNFILLHVADQFSQHHLLKRLFCLHSIFLPLLSKTKVPIGAWSHPPSGDLPDPGIKPGSPALQVDSLPAEIPGKPYF